MADRDLAITVEHLSKRFRIPLDRSATLKHRLTHWRSASRYRILEALLDVSFEVEAGEFVGIIGHNGSGKSTLLKILSRIYRPNAGVVAIQGRVSPFLELGVGFNPELTARENIFLSGAILGLSRPELHRRLDEIIGFAELEQFVDHKLKNFSSGMQVRLAFSLAIQAHAEILMMDEVLAVGDAPFQQKCFDVFTRYKREGRTVVLVTHELSAVTTYCDRALLLDHGRLVADGDTADVTAQYRHAIGMAADGAHPDAEIERWGSRDVVVTGIRMLDERGVEDANPATGGFVRIELGYEIQNDAVADFTCVLWILRGDGLMVSEVELPVSQYAQVGESQRGSAGTIRFDIPQLSLLDGKYSIDVELQGRRDRAAFDHLKNALHFRVIDRRERRGVIEPGGAWSVVPAEQPADQPEQLVSTRRAGRDERPGRRRS
ncbi:MAG: ABC transporter ATP-binding protein [Candidatus Dormibacteria bacterium]